MEYNFRKQLNKIGCYAAIIFDTNLQKSSAPEVEIDYSGPNEWEFACKAGVLIFFDYFKRRNICKLDVKIRDVLWLSVDTNNIIVQFATVKALCESLNFEIEELALKLDLDKQIFTFPDPRIIGPTERSLP